jgi:hypothetical protein
MSAHQFQITVNYLGGKHAGPDLHEPLVFEAGNHDDIIGIIETVQRANLFDRDTSAALVLGMKLFSEVMLKNRKDPLFQPILAAYLDYVGQFKQRIKEGPRQYEAGDSDEESNGKQQSR